MNSKSNSFDQEKLPKEVTTWAAYLMEYVDIKQLSRNLRKMVINNLSYDMNCLAGDSEKFMNDISILFEFLDRVEDANGGEGSLE